MLIFLAETLYLIAETLPIMVEPFERPYGWSGWKSHFYGWSTQLICGWNIHPSGWNSHLYDWNAQPYGLNAQFYYWNVNQLCGRSSQRLTVETSCVLLAAVYTKVRQALRTQAFTDAEKWTMKSLALPRPGIEPTLSACIHSAVCRASHHQATTRVCDLRALFTYWPLHFVWL